MEGLDLLILAVLLVGLARGVSTGGIKQVLGLAGVVLAFIAAAQFMQPAGERLVRAFGVGEHYAPAIGFGLIFLIVQGAAFLLARSLEKLLDSLELGFINRLFGGALGVFKGALLLSLLFYLGSYVRLPQETSREESLFYDPVSKVLPATWNYLSDRLSALRPLEPADDTSLLNPLDGLP